MVSYIRISTEVDVWAMRNERMKQILDNCKKIRDKKKKTPEQLMLETQAEMLAQQALANGYSIHKGHVII